MKDTLPGCWLYNPRTGKAGHDPQGLIPRERIEEATKLLHESGIRNQLFIVDVLKALSGLSKSEIRFNVELTLAEIRPNEFLLVGGVT